MLRRKKYAYRTKDTFVNWVKRFIGVPPNFSAWKLADHAPPRDRTVFHFAVLLSLQASLSAANICLPIFFV
jgi:hypothetical protein